MRRNRTWICVWMTGWPFSGAMALAQAPLDVQFTNLRSDRFSVFWKTTGPVSGFVQYSPNPNGPWMDVPDGRGANFVGTTHHCSQKGLTPDTLYYIQILSGGFAYLNGTSPWMVKTGKTVSPPVGSDQVYGRVLLSDNSTPAVGTVVFLRVADNNGVGSIGSSAVISVLTNSDGWWVYEMVNALEETLAANFEYSKDGADKFFALADGASLGSTSILIGTNENKPAPAMVLAGAASPVAPAASSGVGSATSSRGGARSSGGKKKSSCLLATAGDTSGRCGYLAFVLVGLVLVAFRFSRNLPFQQEVSQ